MMTGMTEDDWAIVLEMFDAARSRRSEPGRDDRKFLEAIHFFTVHSVTWHALPAEHGNWNSVTKQFWRLAQALSRQWERCNDSSVSRCGARKP